MSRTSNEVRRGHKRIVHFYHGQRRLASTQTQYLVGMKMHRVLFRKRFASSYKAGSYAWCGVQVRLLDEQKVTYRKKVGFRQSHTIV